MRAEHLLGCLASEVHVVRDVGRDVSYMVWDEGVLSRGLLHLLDSRVVSKVELILSLCQKVLGFAQVSESRIRVCEIHDPRENGVVIWIPDHTSCVMV